MDVYIKKKDWLMIIVLILFLLVIIIMPFAAEYTYAGRNESPNHILTYTTGNLVWNNATDVDEKTGVAELSLFNSSYQNVQAENTDKVIAPGTEGKNIIRLKNDTENSIEYIAVMYRMKNEDTLPVEPVMADDSAFSTTIAYPLPDGVSQEQVVKAVTGTVGANNLQDFDIIWQWKYYESGVRDRIDTILGNKAAWNIPDEVQAGLYIIVAEGSDTGAIAPDPDDPYTYPEVPQTGDSNNLALYQILMIISGVFLLLMMVDRRKEKQCKKS